MTEWRSIKGLEVSELGEVRGQQNVKGGGAYYARGYVYVRHNNQTLAIHRLVCEAFHGPAPVGKRRVLHWNDVSDDNRAINLRWGNAKENVEDAVRNGKAVGPKAWKRNKLAA